MTLLELLLSIALILLTMATLFGFYEVSLSATSRAEKYNVRTQQARVVLQQLAREIRQASAGASEKLVPIKGTMHSLTMYVSQLPGSDVMQTYGIGDKVPPPVGDVHLVQYYMAVDPDSPDEDGNPGVVGLVRQEERPIDEQTLANEEVVDETQIDDVRHVRMMAPDVKYIRFYYFDGTNWLDAWPGTPGTNGLPQAIKIEIGFTPDTLMLSNQEQVTGTEVDLMGNPDNATPADGRYCLIVRPPSVGLFAGGAQQGMGGLSGLSDLSGMSGTTGLSGETNAETP